MFEHTPYYRNYQRYNYNNYATNRYNNYNNYNNTTFTPMYNYFYEQSNYHDNNQRYTDTNNISTENINETIFNNEFEKGENSDKKNFRIGPIQIEDNNINVFGFSLAIDDLIIIGLIILLFFQSDKDYTLIIILGLMLFNISFSNLDFFRGL